MWNNVKVTNKYVLGVLAVEDEENEAEKISEEIIAENSYKLVNGINQYSRSSVNTKQDKYKENHIYVYYGEMIANQM